MIAEVEVMKHDHFLKFRSLNSKIEVKFPSVSVVLQDSLHFHSVGAELLSESSSHKSTLGL